MKHAAILALSVALAAPAPRAAAQPPAKPPAGADIKAKYPLDPPRVESKTKYKVETVAEGLQVPWGFAFLPGGKAMLFTERPGRVRLIENGKLHPATVFTVPDVLAPGGEKGLMGICLHPQFEKNHWVYLAYASKDMDIRVLRYIYTPPKAPGASDAGTLADDTVILKGMPSSRNPNHAGCRIKFGPEGKLYITAGENFKRTLAPDMTSLGGKVLRVNDDGSIPADNPFAGEEQKAKGVRGEIWSFGNRNPQGIDWDPKTGLLWETEHGPSGESTPPSQGGDELNIIEKGHDYGWPTIHHDQRKEGMETPVIEWSPAIAPASGNFYNGSLFPEWKGNFFVGALGGLGGGKRPGIVRLVVDGRNVTGVEWIATDYNRIREVVQGPDGAIWFSTSNKDGRAQPDPKDDRILRIVPAKD